VTKGYKTGYKGGSSTDEVAQALSPLTGTPAYERSGVAQSQDYSAQTPASAHYLVPESTGNLESGSLGSCSITVQLCDLKQVTSHL
jgi:hypothetical protein